MNGGTSVFAPLGDSDREGPEREDWRADADFGPDLAHGEDEHHQDHEGFDEGFDEALDEALRIEAEAWPPGQETWPDREDWAPDPEGYGPGLAGDVPEREDLEPEDQGYGSRAEWAEDLQFEAEEYARHALFEALDASEDLGEAQEVVRAVPAGARPPIRTTAALRAAWSQYACTEARMVPLRLLGWTTPVNPVTVHAWRALEAALVGAGYQAHRAWVFNCRDIAGQTTRSLHAYGLAVDIDHAKPTCNVNRATPDQRAVRFSTAATKEARCADVARGVADTAFTPAQVAAVEAIRTVDGHQVFAWGGRWRTTKDTMHFQINVTPEELARGLRDGAPPAASGVIVEPQPSHYADLARKILRGRKRSVGVVLSVVQVVPTGQVIDTRTERSGRRPRLVNPPPHVVLPAEVYEITFKRSTLRYVWILSNEKATFPVGGILFLPPADGTVFHLVTFNVGALDGGACTNVHHAEMQATRWIQEQPPDNRALIRGVSIWNLSRKTGLGYSPCNPCCVDLAQFLTDLQAGKAVEARITWLTLYDRNARCGHPTDLPNVRGLQAAGWTVQGPLPL